jgi:hypothetical protein
MISMNMALRLKQAGLKWTPKLHDFFAIPERGMDANIFVLSDLQANIEKLFGSEVVAFQGASEWALDYLVSSEAVWMPREGQLRAALMKYFPGGQPRLRLDCTKAGCYLEASHNEMVISVRASQVEDAYAEALLQALNMRETRAS